MAVSRQQIIHAIQRALEPEDHINAVWLGGSTARGEEDPLSDIDVFVDTADGRHEDAVVATEAALGTLAPIEHRYRLPEPTWHGHTHCVYRLQGCPEHLCIDLHVWERSNQASRYLEKEIHGTPAVLFDKLAIVENQPTDWTAHRESLRRHLDSTWQYLCLYRHRVSKQLARDCPGEAVLRYEQFILRPLQTILRTRYTPKYYFYLPVRIKRDLPDDVYQRFTRLCFVSSVDDLEDKAREAIAWAEDTYRSLDVDALEF